MVGLKRMLAMLRKVQNKINKSMKLASTNLFSQKKGVVSDKTKANFKFNSDP